MKKIQVSFIVCILFNLFPIAYSQVFFPKKVTYKVAQLSSKSTVPSIAECYKNMIEITVGGNSFAQLELKGPTTPLPPGPKPCNPGRCYPLIFTLDGDIFKLTIEGKKTDILVRSIRGRDFFKNAIKKSPGKEIVLSDPSL